MAEKNRILLVRLGFVLLCLVPTLVVTAWAAAHAAATKAVDKSQWEEEIEWLLGLDVAIERVSRPAAGVTLLESVEFADPETGPLGRVGSIELARTERGIELIASQVEMPAAGLGRVAELVHDRGLRSRHDGDLPIHFSAGEVTISQKSGAGVSQGDTLVDFDGWIVPSEAGPQLSLNFRRVGATGQPVELHLLRKNRLSAEPATYWSLDTAGAALPCWLVARQIPALKRLGERSQFVGKVWGEQSFAGWHGEFDGRLQDVDLNSLVTHQFPHLLSGAAAIEARAVMRDGRLQSAAGSIHSRGGTIGRSLVASVCDAFALNCRSLATNTNKNWRYNDLHLGFDLNVEGIKLAGNCDALGEVLMIDDDGAVVTTQPPTMHVPVLSLAEALSRSAGSQSRVTREGQALLELLPLPTTNHVESGPPQGTVRLPN